MSDAAYVCSYPKAGRTWVRYMLACYLNALYSLGLDVDLLTMFKLITNDKDDPPRGPEDYAYSSRPEIPRILFSHRPPYEQVQQADRLVFLIRSPLDMLVSFHLHLTKHSAVIQSSLPEYLRGPRGVSHLVKYLNAWADLLEQHPRTIVTYEAMTADTPAVFRTVLEGLAVPYQADLAAAAAEGASFQAMQRLEQQCAVSGRDYPRQNVDARRIRRGRIGGYRDCMSRRDVHYVCDTLGAVLTDQAWAMLADHGLADELLRGRTGWLGRFWRRTPKPPAPPGLRRQPPP